MERRLYEETVEMLCNGIDRLDDIEEVLLDMLLADNPKMEVYEGDEIVKEFMAKYYDEAEREAYMLCDEAMEWELARAEGMRGDY